MIDSLMPYNGEQIVIHLVGLEDVVVGKLHIHAPDVILVGEMRISVDKIVAWKPWATA